MLALSKESIFSLLKKISLKKYISFSKQFKKIVDVAERWVWHSFQMNIRSKQTWTLGLIFFCVFVIFATFEGTF